MYIDLRQMGRNYAMEARSRLDFTVIPQRFYENKESFLHNCGTTIADQFWADMIGEFYEELIFSEEWENTDFSLDPNWFVKPDQIRFKTKSYPDNIHLLYISQPEPKEEAGDYCKAYVLAYKRTEDLMNFSFIYLYTIELRHPNDRCIGTITDFGLRSRVADLPETMEKALDKIHEIVAAYDSAPVVREQSSGDGSRERYQVTQRDDSWMIHDTRTGEAEIHYTDENGHEMRVYGRFETESEEKPPLTGDQKLIQDFYAMMECIYSLMGSLQVNLQALWKVLLQETGKDVEECTFTIVQMDQDARSLKHYLYGLYEKLVAELGLPEPMEEKAWKDPDAQTGHFDSLDWTLLPYNFAMSGYSDLYVRMDRLMEILSFGKNRAAWLLLKDAKPRLEQYERTLSGYGSRWKEIEDKL